MKLLGKGGDGCFRKSWQVGSQPLPMGNGTFVCIYDLIFSVKYRLYILYAI